MATEADTDVSSIFECSICLDVPKKPVVTLCGHLYCWRCLHKWLTSQQGTQTCPVCKADIYGDSIIPIYGRESETTKTKDANLPPRPRAPLPAANAASNPYIRNPLLSNQEASQPGALWTVLGINGGSQGSAMTPEQQHQAFLTRLLLLLGSFVILCLLLF